MRVHTRKYIRARRHRQCACTRVIGRGLLRDICRCRTGFLWSSAYTPSSSAHLASPSDSIWLPPRIWALRATLYCLESKLRCEFSWNGHSQSCELEERIVVYCKTGRGGAGEAAGRADSRRTVLDLVLNGLRACSRGVGTQACARVRYYTCSRLHQCTDISTRACKYSCRLTGELPRPRGTVSP